MAARVYSAGLQIGALGTACKCVAHGDVLTSRDHVPVKTAMEKEQTRERARDRRTIASGPSGRHYMDPLPLTQELPVFNQTKIQHIFQDLESSSPRSKIKT